MAIVISGHGVRCEAPNSFVVPKGFKVYFWTRDGTIILDSSARRIEDDPHSADFRLAVNTYSGGGLCPNYWILPPGENLRVGQPNGAGYFRFMLQNDQSPMTLETVLWVAESVGMADRLNPRPVHWCACRKYDASLARRSWQEDLRRDDAVARNLARWKTGR